MSRFPDGKAVPKFASLSGMGVLSLVRWLWNTPAKVLLLKAI
jgi:hypothetical protein